MSTTGRHLRRSVAMLGSVRGSIALTVALGLTTSALPFVANAALGPVMESIADAGLSGNLASVWESDGALLSRGEDQAWGPLAWLNTPLPFAVLLALWAVSLIAAQIVGMVNTWIDARLKATLLTEIRQRVHDHIQTLSLDFFSGARIGALMQRVQLEAAGVQRLVTDCLIPPAVDTVVLLAALAYLIALSWQMTAVSMVLAPLVFIALRLTGRRLHAATQQMTATHRSMGGELEQTVSGISEVQVFNAAPRRSAVFHGASAAAAKSIAAMTIWTQAGASATQALIALSTAAVLIAGITLSAGFGLTFAALVVFIGFVPTTFAAVGRIVGSYSAYRATMPNVVATFELLDTEPSVRDRIDAQAIGEVRGNLVFEDVVFSYTPGRTLLDGLSFSIAEGETVAIVGGIGSGKSTVFNLVLRFLDPQHGRILLDGHDISEVTIATLREQVSKLAQFPYFAKDTIRENVRMARQDASDAEVEQACRVAQVHAIINDPARIPQGYDTVVDVQVPSGGQKRLIALARCLLRRPEVLLLDEPTENLDSDQRSRLIRVIRDYAHDRTCVVISHDMDFIAAVADRILVLADGRVVEQGTHAQLLDLNGRYRTLYEAQNVDASGMHKP
ncbi:ABC transporter ATP-binding protein [Mycolicibacterium sp. BiH015]|uniref:ABC transporter ATP-binding protein n=1 Tax=Mycolicibacterium sp. BiH015 TaxID=3018808 RepID=UPI0022E4E6D9|nr:ABC transporter ATP-binding protein [Mycolicibacterium sp. BiH015]MDA2892496.1 ABC transporter ATP-binding protein [Mycolicibacterium sp. BiH015]